MTIHEGSGAGLIVDQSGAFTRVDNDTVTLNTANNAVGLIVVHLYDRNDTAQIFTNIRTEAHGDDGDDVILSGDANDTLYGGTGLTS